MEEPTQPEAPNYVVNPLEKQSPELLEKLAEYCKNLAEYKRKQNLENIDPEIEEKLKEKKGPVKQDEMVKCGKDSCSSCPHGPYTYEYKWEDGRVVSSYVG